MSQPIDEALASLCAKHNVYVFEISINLKQSEDWRYFCGLHFDGPTKFNGCVHGHGPTVQDAITDALNKMAEDRAIADEAVSLTLEAA